MTPNSYFNSIKVQLEQAAGLNPYLMLEFQFHKGTIRTAMVYLIQINLFNFNSIKVQLELPVRNLLTIINLHFNSIKVQLELATQYL